MAQHKGFNGSIGGKLAGLLRRDVLLGHMHFPACALRLAELLPLACPLHAIANFVNRESFGHEDIGAFHEIRKLGGGTGVARESDDAVLGLEAIGIGLVLSICRRAPARTGSENFPASTLSCWRPGTPCRRQHSWPSRLRSAA